MEQNHVHLRCAAAEAREVVRVETDPPGMGVVFKELSSYSKSLIEKLLTAKSSAK